MEYFSGFRCVFPQKERSRVWVNFYRIMTPTPNRPTPPAITGCGQYKRSGSRGVVIRYAYSYY